MSSRKIGGVPLTEVQDQVAYALRSYEDVTDNAAWFHIAGAVELALTPNKPNTARSQSSIRFGRHAVTFFVIAFMPGDGTGDETAHKLDSLRSTQPYPATTSVVPRDKSATERELHLAIASFQPGSTAKTFAGCLDLIGLDNSGTGLRRLGSLGQTREQFASIMRGHNNADPTATYTLWRVGDRTFGGEHAVYNDTGVLQVCGFASIPRGVDPGILRALNPQLPVDANRSEG